MPAYAYAILVAGWLLWMTPFALIKRSRHPAKHIDPRARWGVVIVAIGYSLLWQGKFCVRHPIYTSMLCVLLATGFVVTPLPLFLLAIVVFVFGTEIRVRIEDNLLASQFGETFHQYQQNVPAYIPFLK